MIRTGPPGSSCGRFQLLQAHQNLLEQDMDVSSPASLSLLRCAVGYLGERDQFGWWPSAFFSASARAFLAPVFARTQTLAQASGVSLAAARVHDDRIGVGQVYHLFRLPEDLEQGIHRALHEPDISAQIALLTASREAALGHLAAVAGASIDLAGAIGPIMAGNIGDLRRRNRLDLLAAHYLHGFRSGVQVYPFLASGAT